MSYVSRSPLYEQWHTGGFLVSTPNGHRHIDRGLFSGAVKIYPGTVMGKVTATGKWVPCTKTASDGSENAAGISYGLVDATLNDVEGALVVRSSEVNKSELVWDASMDASAQTAALAALAALEIIAR